VEKIEFNIMVNFYFKKKKKLNSPLSKGRCPSGRGVAGGSRGLQRVAKGYKFKENSMKRNILEAAKVIRSKNAGPFELTLDVIFKNKEYFELFKEKNIITKEVISDLYQIKIHDIADIIYFEPSNAIKITMRRWQASGEPGESDIYGAQQHAPLLGIEF
jgi:uncharacterized protein DUF4387